MEQPNIMPLVATRSYGNAATTVVLVATAVGTLCGCRSRGSQHNPATGASATLSPAAVLSAARSATAGSASSSTPASGLSAILPPMVRIEGDAGPLAKGIPVPVASVDKEVNPTHLEPYAGPTGVVEGTVRVRGDKPASQPVTAGESCADAHSFYGKAFREGDDRTLADALVAVTEYKGYVPAQGDSVRAKIVGCSFDRRLYAVTYGQKLEVVNLNSKLSFIPDLKGADMPARMVAVPRGDPVQLYPTVPGYYELRDELNHPYMAAGVYVVRYSTHAVTGIDGKYRISGIPVGKVKVSALQPATEKPEEHTVEVKPNESTKVDFELTYKVKKLSDPKESMAPYIR
jgi:hypothetical protein